jgi:hypothetical protein
MKFSNLLMASVQALNGAPSEARAAVLPPRDPHSFREAVSRLQRTMQRPEVKQIASTVEAAEKAIDAAVDPHMFAPPGIS